MWKDYEELEENLSMPELLATLNQYVEKIWEERKFLAALQGVDLEKEAGDETDSALDRVAKRAAERLSANIDNMNDITSLKGKSARDAGFGIGDGLVHEVIA